MADQAMRFVLGCDADAANAGIDGIRQREVDDPRLAAEIDGRLGTSIGHSISRLPRPPASTKAMAERDRLPAYKSSLIIVLPPRPAFRSLGDHGMRTTELILLNQAIRVRCVTTWWPVWMRRGTASPRPTRLPSLRLHSPDDKAFVRHSAWTHPVRIRAGAWKRVEADDLDAPLV